jgi:hypothetical protein
MMKSWHIILIVAVGMSLIFVAPTPEKAGQADKVDTASKPPPDSRPVPATAAANFERASFDGDRSKTKRATE